LIQCRQFSIIQLVLAGDKGHYWLTSDGEQQAFDDLPDMAADGSCRILGGSCGLLEFHYPNVEIQCVGRLVDFPY
jgi:hypothetical protein